MSGPDGSSIKRKIRCAAGMHGRSLAYCVPPMVLYVERRVRVFKKEHGAALCAALLFYSEDTMDKVLLILVDGMRPDSIATCGSEYADNMLKSCRYKDMQAKTVFPSVTLPCHMSLFHSVVPQRHGILTNTFVPMARPVDGLIEKLHNAGKRCAFYYTWEQLRDLAKPGMLDCSLYSAMFHEQGIKADRTVTDAAIAAMAAEKPDFIFLYLGWADETGHRFGWMSEEYLDIVSEEWANIERVLAATPEEYKVIITADHGGHDMNHGSDAPEDMTIPVIIPEHGSPDEFTGKPISILDIAPTIAKWLGAAPDEQWIGRPIVK